MQDNSKLMHIPSEHRYNNMQYRRSGKSGMKLPLISLGLWHNFGDVDPYTNSRDMIIRAFDLGITHFDLANNYGPPPGSAEATFGRILKEELGSYRDEMIISSKAGYYMWPGPYGEWGSRKYLLSSLDQSLKRLGIDYVDIFYSHRPDPETPLEETMSALDQAVRQGKALYAGISSYNGSQTHRAAEILKSLGTPCVIHQPRYNMFDRWIEGDLMNTLETHGMGCIVFSPLAQGLLTNRYFSGIPADSRAGKPHGFLRPYQITDEMIVKLKKLNDIAANRGQKLSQLALAWVLRLQGVTSAIIGASKVEQIEDAVNALNNLQLSTDELRLIDEIVRNE